MQLAYSLIYEYEKKRKIEMHAYLRQFCGAGSPVICCPHDHDTLPCAAVYVYIDPKAIQYHYIRIKSQQQQQTNRHVYFICFNWITIDNRIVCDRNIYIYAWQSFACHIYAAIAGNSQQNKTQIKKIKIENNNSHNKRMIIKIK